MQKGINKGSCNPAGAFLSYLWCSIYSATREDQGEEMCGMDSWGHILDRFFCPDVHWNGHAGC